MDDSQEKVKKFPKNTHQTHVDFQVCEKVHTSSASSVVFKVPFHEKKIEKQKEENERK